MDYIKGSLAGMFGVIISHPFDTIKSNIQNSRYVHKYTPKILYKGLLSPLIGTSFEKGIVFGTYSYLKSNNISTPISGGIAGLIASFMITPYERLKIIKQNNVLINKINIKTLFSGLSFCILRDSPGFAIYFSNYEYLKYKLYESKNVPITKLGAFLIGGSSGLLAWIFIYPQDKIKTILQSSKENKSFGEIKDLIYNECKLKNAYKGFSYALYRAVPLHAGTFMMYEILRDL